MIRFTAVLSANPAPASAKTRPRQTLRFGDLAREIASSMLTIVLIDNERGGRWEGKEVPISWNHNQVTLAWPYPAPLAPLSAVRCLESWRQLTEAQLVIKF